MGISRQAVSKWETGESLPDINTLTQLAEILGVSVDSLCLRQCAGDGPAENAGIGNNEAAGRPHKWLWMGLAALCLVVGVIIGLLAGKSYAPSQPSDIPDTITAQSVNFQNEDGALVCRFVLSTEAEDYTCRLSCNPGQEAVDVAMENGGCTGSLTGLDVGQEYTIIVTVSNGRYSRNICLAEALTIDAENGVSWSPAK